MGSEVSIQLGKKVRRLRKRHGLSQEQLAEKASTNRVTISKIELGKVNVGVDLLANVAEALQVSASSLLEECQEPPKGEALRKNLDDLLNQALESDLHLIYKITRTILTQ